MAHVEVLAGDGRLRGNRENERAYRMTVWGDVGPEGEPVEFANLYVNDPPGVLYEQAMALAMAAGKMLTLAREQEDSARWTNDPIERVCDTCSQPFYGEADVCAHCHLAAQLQDVHDALQVSAGGCEGLGCQHLPRGDDMTFCAEHTPDWHTV